MQDCWNDDKDSRPTFRELKELFDSLMSYEERYNYLILNGEMAKDVESAPQPTDYSDPNPKVERGCGTSNRGHRRQWFWAGSGCHHCRVNVKIVTNKVSMLLIMSMHTQQCIFPSMYQVWKFSILICTQLTFCGNFCFCWVHNTLQGHSFFSIIYATLIALVILG